MRKSILAAAAFALATTMGVGATPALADHHEAGEIERQNVDWYQLTMTKFKPGKIGRAREIINDYFDKALTTAGIEAKAIHVNIGDYDQITLWPMKAGPDQMSWRRNPEFAKAWEALKELTGSEEKRQELIDEFDSLIAYEKESLVHIDRPDAE